MNFWHQEKRNLTKKMPRNWMTKMKMMRTMMMTNLLTMKILSPPLQNEMELQKPLPISKFHNNHEYLVLYGC